LGIIGKSESAQLGNGFQRVFQDVTFACREANLCKACYKVGEVMLALLLLVEKRQRAAIPFVECRDQPSDLYFTARPFFNSFEVP
jgi:hypothetical protein